MSKFQFNLERVLQWRALQLTLEEAKLKRMLDELQFAELNMNRVRQEIIESNLAVSKLDGIHGIDLNLMAEHRHLLTKELSVLRQRLIEKRKLTEAQVAKHRDAKQRHRLLEELRTKRHSEWQAQMMRELDELAHDSYLARWKAS